MTDQNKSVETLQTDVDKIAADLVEAKKLTDETLKKTKAEAAAIKAEVIANEVKTAKETANKKLEALAGKTDATSKAEIVKLEAEIKKYETMLTTLDSSKTELATLKAGVDPTLISKAIQDNLDKTAPADNTKVAVTEKKNRFKKQIDGFSDKAEENHWRKNAGRVVLGIGAWILIYKWIKSLFGRGKDKTEKKDGETTEKKGFLWKAWDVIKVVALWGWIYYVIHGLVSGRWSMADFFNRDKKAGYESNDPKKFDEVYDKESAENKVKYDELWTAVNDFFGTVYGSATGETWSDMLWEQSGDDDFEKHTWTMPCALDDASTDVGDILDGTSDFGKKLDTFWAKVSKDVGKQINPLNRFSGAGASEEDLAKLDKETIRKYQAYRKTLKVQVFLHQKEKVLIRRLVAEKLGITDYATATESVKKTYEEKIDEGMDDDATMTAVQTKMETIYYNQKLTGIMAVLKKYDIANDEMVPDTKEALVEIDQDKNDLIGDTLDKATVSADINTETTLKEDVNDVCDDFDEKINDENNQLIDFDNFFIWLGDAWLNMEAGDKQEILKEIGYTEKIWAYSTKVLAIKAKITAGTATKADMLDLQKTIDDYYMFKKDIMLGISFVHEADDKGTGIGRTLLYIWGKLLGVVEWIYDAAWWGVVWFAVAWVATIWGLYIAGKVIKWWVKKTVVWWLNWCKWITKDPGKVLIGRKFYRHIRYGQESKTMQAIRRQSYKWDKWYTRFSEDFLDGKISSQEAKKIITLNQKNWTKNQYWTGANIEEMLKKWGFILESDTRANKLLITTYFDQNKNFRKAIADPKLRSKVLLSMAEYDTKLKSLTVAWETKKLKFLEDMFTYARFKNWDELISIVKNIDDVKIDLSTLDEKQIMSLAKKLSKKISSTTTVDEIVASVSDVKKTANAAADIIKNLTVEQKKVAALIATDAEELEKSISKLGIDKTTMTGKFYQKQIDGLQQFEKKIASFTDDEITAFNALRKMEFKSYHIVEMFEFKKISKVGLEIEKLKTWKAADLSWLLRELKTSKAAGQNVSDSLIKTIGDINTKNLVKNADEAAEFAKNIFKFLAKIT